jgi:hypothetical protein
MVIVALTPEEVAKHERAVEKIRRKLFATHTPEEFGIVPGSEEIMRATAEERWMAGVGEYRVIRWGGLRYAIEAQGDPFKLTITHFERDTFTFHISNKRGHTEVVTPAKFADIDRIAWHHVSNLHRPKPPYSQRR